MEKIILEVTKEDINNAEGFCTNCILEMAAKRQFNTSEVSEGVNGMIIRGFYYEHRYFGLDEYKTLKANPQPFTIELTPSIK